MTFYPGGLDSVKELHLEISSRCNSACPQCPRNLYGYPFNDGYVERDMSLNDVKQIFQPEFVKQLWQVLINGNFGDIVMNHDAVDILKYFCEHNPGLRPMIITNGGARDADFWKALAKLKCRVIFCLEGTDNHTHALYRQNTLYDVVLKNAQTFIAAGGVATWKMVKFEHNQHQIQQAQQLSQDLGFAAFELIDDQRDTGPVYNKSGELVHVMRPAIWQNMGRTTSLAAEIALRTSTVVTPDSLNTAPKSKINCKVINSKSIYVSSTGNVYPCCWLGMSPETYGNGCYMQGANSQLRPLIAENNALEHDLAHCVKWFESVKQSWDQPSVAAGRLIHCNDNCGCN
jgi:MoaA/NifB/PqqE/SkfB family radical SAM enzyme